MNETLMNELSVQKDTILLSAMQSNVEIEDLKEQFEKSLMTIINKLSKFKDEDKKNMLIELMKELKAELRHNLIKLCQEKSLQLNQYGLENIDYFDNNEFKPIIMISDLIEMCDEKIESFKKQDNEIIDEENAIYIFMDRCINDLDDYPKEFAFDFKDIMDRVYSESHKGKENRCKIMSDSNLDNTIEHRGNNATRLYENQIKVEENAKISRYIKDLEKKLGKQIHFVYKLEVKKCTSANGLDKMREERYKNSRKDIKELLVKMKVQDVLDYAESQKEKLEKVLEEKIKKANKENRDKVIGLYKINDYLNMDYDSKIFDGFIDGNISEVEIPEEEFKETECYELFRRIYLYLKSVKLEKLQKLDVIFDGVKSDFSIDEIPENLPKSQKDIIKQNEKNRIIAQIVYTLRYMTFEELIESQRDIIMLINFEEEYKYYKRKEERQNERHI